MNLELRGLIKSPKELPQRRRKLIECLTNQTTIANNNGINSSKASTNLKFLRNFDLS